MTNTVYANQGLILTQTEPIENTNWTYRKTQLNLSKNTTELS